MKPRPWRGLLPAFAALALLLTPSVSLAGERLPDIKALPPTEISLEVTSDGRHLLRFTQAFANIGSGPLRVQGAATVQDDVMQGFQQILDDAGNLSRSLPTSSVIFHPYHQHWHAGDVAAYELRQGSPWGPVAAKNGKISYCLVDDHHYAEYDGPYSSPQYFNCKTAAQGLTAGWVDVYEATLHDQWIDVTEVADGVYFMAITGDPNHVYLEADSGDWTNNLAWIKVELSGDRSQVRVMAPDEILVRVNGQRAELPVRSRLVGSRAMAHVRLAEHLGASVRWDGRKVIITTESHQLELFPGYSTAWVDGGPMEMGTEAVVEDGRVLVPLRFLCERLGATVTYDWLGATAHIEMTKPPGD